MGSLKWVTSLAPSACTGQGRPAVVFIDLLCGLLPAPGLPPHPGSQGAMPADSAAKAFWVLTAASQPWQNLQNETQKHPIPPPAVFINAQVCVCVYVCL